MQVVFSLYVVLAFGRSWKGQDVTAQDSTPAPYYGPPNIPTWFVIPQRAAGYPVYMPQMPVYAAGSSSDYVNSWGDFRWSNFYDAAQGEEPDNDPVYNDPWGLKPSSLSPGDATTAAPDASTDAATEATTQETTTAAPAETTTAARPAREFHDLVSALSNMVATQPELSSADVNSLLMRLLAGSNGTTILHAATTAPVIQKDNVALKKSAGQINAKSQLSLPQLLRNSKPTPDMIFLSALDSGSNSSVGPRDTREFSFPLNITGGRNTTALRQTIWDLFQIAVARIPSPAGGGFIIAPTPLFKSLQRKPGSGKAGELLPMKREESTSSANSVISPVNPAEPRSNRTTVNISSSKSLFDLPAMVLPIVMSSLDRLSQPTVSPLSSNTLLAAAATTAGSLATSSPSPTMSPALPTTAAKQTVSTLPLIQIPVVSVQTTQTTSVTPAVKLNNLTGNNTTARPALPAAMQRKGLCAVDAAGKRRIGVCVDNGTLQDDCDGMAIKKSSYCGLTMSCCFDVTLSAD